MERKELILVGGGGHCKSVIEVAESAGYSILGILDMPEEVGKTVLGHKVVGTDDDIPQFVGKAEFVITVGFIMDSALSTDNPSSIYSSQPKHCFYVKIRKTL